MDYETKFILKPDAPQPLLNLCKARVGALLRDQFYHPVGKAKTYVNPFGFVPTRIINELFEMVMRSKKKNRSSIANMLRPLLTSGRLTELLFGFRKLVAKDFIEIFDVLAPRAQHVRKMTFESFVHDDDCLTEKPSFIQAVKSIVPKCKNIEYLGVPTPAFEMKFINELPKLKVLLILTVRGQELQSPTTEVPHYNLTHVVCYSAPVDMIVTFLTYCPNLISLNCNITEALHLLHGKQLSDGTLSKVYALREFRINNTALDLASKTCPMAKVLNLVSYANVLVQHRSDFDGLKNVETLDYREFFFPPRTMYRGYYPEHEKLLKCMGQTLKHLKLHCERVDFEALGICCPNLTSLEVSYLQPYNVHNSSVGCFSKLESFCLVSSLRAEMVREVLSCILHNCKGLSALTLINVICLTDELLDNLLRNNGLRSLQNLSLDECPLTEKSIRMLLTKCSSLKQIIVRSLLQPELRETFRQVFQDMYPHARTPETLPDLLLDSYPVEKRPSRSRKRALQE